MVAQIDLAGATVKVATLSALQGTVQIVTGARRGFYTSVMTQALRLAGQGTAVLVIQFLKGGIGQGPDKPMHLCQNLRWVRCDLGRCLDTPQLDLEEQRAMQDLWKYTKRSIQAGRFGLVVLDELSLAIQFGLIPEQEVVELLRERPSYMDIVLTGPEMPQAVRELADQVTELRKVPAQT